MPRPATVSPDRILAVAAVEFADRGYAGARVDRIARRARVNKAMLYYHFGSKQALYRTLLRQTFTAAAAELSAVADGSGSPVQKVERLVAVFAAFVEAHPHFPAVMLREVAEGGVHLDRATLAAMASLPAIVGRIVMQGADDRSLRRVHPVMAYFTMFAPIVLFLGGAPIRRALVAQGLLNLKGLSADAFIAEMQTSVRLALVASPAKKAAS